MPMHIIFDVNQQDLRHKSRLVDGGNVVNSTEHTIYSSTIKYVYVRLIILIAVKSALVLMAEYIGNELCMARVLKIFGPAVVRSLVLDVVQ